MDFNPESKKTSLDTVMHCGLAIVLFVALLVLASWPELQAFTA